MMPGVLFIVKSKHDSSKLRKFIWKNDVPFRFVQTPEEASSLMRPGDFRVTASTFDGDLSKLEIAQLQSGDGYLYRVVYRYELVHGPCVSCCSLCVDNSSLPAFDRLKFLEQVVPIQEATMVRDEPVDVNDKTLLLSGASM
jgi:hypothetical protein